MRRGLLLVAVTAVAGLSPGSAFASGSTTYCVPNTSIAGCPSAGVAEASIGAAVSASTNGDHIVIGPGSFPESVSDGGKSLTFTGEGPSKTIVQGQGSPAFNVSAGSSVSNLRVNLWNGTGNTGLMLAGVASGVEVTATLPKSTSNNIGVDLAGGTFRQGVVALPVSGGDAQFYGGVEGSGTVSDSAIAAAVGVTYDSSEGMPTVHRVRILANQGVLGSVVGIDDSLIRTEPGAAPELGIGMPSNTLFGTLTVRHVTLVGSGATGSTGISAVSNAFPPTSITTATIDSAIVRGYATSIQASASQSGFGTASTDVAVKYSDYDPARARTSSTGGASATITPSHCRNFDPLFVRPSVGDYALRAGSRAIDAGDPAPLASGESHTDLAGHPRVLAGRRGDRAIGDMGAYEFVPHRPVVHASAASRRVRVDASDTFHAAGSDASPGDRLTFRWRFDDGATASGARVKHAWKHAGHHRATVTARDLDGYIATASVTIVVVKH